MIHDPSNYKATITLTIQQIIELHKAVSARITFLTIQATDEEYPYRDQDIQDLLEVAEIFDKHEEIAVNEWEAKVVKAESALLNDELKLKEFLSDG